MTRLGFSQRHTQLGPRDEALLEKAFQEGRMLSQAQGAYARFPILENNGEQIRFADNLVLRSASLAKLLAQSDQVVLMATTIGKGIQERIAAEIFGGNAGYGLMLDAVASETTDAGLDWMMTLINTSIRREGRRLTRHRYSPGYGDLALDNQKIIFDLLKLERLDLILTETFMLIPEKSVIAIAGCERIGMADAVGQS